MIIKEAILQSLEDMKDVVTHWDVLEHIQKKNYYEFEKGKTPESTISAQLGNFIRKGDSRVKRIQRQGNYYEYYLSKYEEELSLKINIVEIGVQDKVITNESYKERDLHLLFSSYLNTKNIYSKTILHEQSNSNDSTQKWIHPDMVGIHFLQLETDVTQQFVQTLNIIDAFKLTSYELKREIRTDSELKKCYFQAVSNSSWANYGYLVAFEINSTLMNEMERLNQSFGIGIIELKSNPYESRVLFQSKYNNLDFKTIDKLCNINDIFKKFITDIEEIVTTKGKPHSRAKKEFKEEFCDKSLESDMELEEYCKDKGIPFEVNENE